MLDKYMARFQKNLLDAFFGLWRTKPRKLLLTLNMGAILAPAMVVWFNYIYVIAPNTKGAFLSNLDMGIIFVAIDSPPSFPSDRSYNLLNLIICLVAFNHC